MWKERVKALKFQHHCGFVAFVCFVLEEKGQFGGGGGGGEVSRRAGVLHSWMCTLLGPVLFLIDREGIQMKNSVIQKKVKFHY